MVISRLLQRVRAVDALHPLLWDVGLALVVAAISVNATVEVTTAGPVPPLPVPLLWVPLVVVHGALVFRRRRPLAALVVAACGVVLGTAAALLTDRGAPWAHLAVWVLLLEVGRRERRGHAVGIASGVVAVTVLAAVLAPAGAADDGERVRTWVAVLAMGTSSLLLGLQVRARHDHLVAQREEAARAAVVAERSRIAQEMHDIIGHNLSVITSLANGGAVAVRTSPDDAVHAFDAIGAVSRSSVRDVARVLSVLRHDHSADGASLAPQPALADVADLIASARAAGVSVAVTHGGGLAGLSAARELAIYRIVQESLTNVLRHAARGAGVQVSIGRDGEDAVVTVEDDGGPGVMAHGGPARPQAAGPGHGILGMRERAESFGGSLEAGPHGLGWRVRARIPAGTGEEL